MRISKPYITNIKSDLIPDASGIRDIGEASLTFAECHFDELYVAEESVHMGTTLVAAPSGLLTFTDASGTYTLGDLVGGGGGTTYQ